MRLLCTHLLTPPSGRPSHYFFVLIRYGPCNIVATPLATAADAQNGDTISFPTAVTLYEAPSYCNISSVSEMMFSFIYYIETVFAFSTWFFRKDIRSSFEIDVEVYSLVRCLHLLF